MYVFSAEFILPCRCSVHNSSYLNPLRGAGIVVQAVRAPDPGIYSAQRVKREFFLRSGHLSEQTPLRKTNKLPTSVELSKPIIVMLLYSGVMQISRVFSRLLLDVQRRLGTQAPWLFSQSGEHPLLRTTTK